MIHKKLFMLIVMVIAALSFVGVAAAQDEVLELTILQDGDVFEDFLSQDDQAVLYVFNANEGDVVTISMVQTVDELDPYLALFGPAGEVLAINDDADLDNGDLSALIEDIELPETGTYFLTASSYHYITTLVELEEEIEGELTFELSISGITPVKNMESDFLFYASDLEAGTPLNADISAEQSAWYFIFTGSEGDVVSLTAESEDFDTIIQIFSPGGARLAVNDDIDRDGGDYNSALNKLKLPFDGVYLVMVSNPFVFQWDEDTDRDDDTLFGAFTIELTSSN